MNTSFLLHSSDSPTATITGYIDNKSALGLALHFDGYSDFCSNDANGTPIYIEHFDNQLRVILYGDINQEDPTHIISLEGARISNRDEPVEEEGGDIGEPSSIQQYLNHAKQRILGILDLDMTDFFDYDCPDEIPEWHWIEKNASYLCKDNGESGVHDFILNTNLEYEHIPEGFLSELIKEAHANDIAYILFHQGC
ncbi:hypothetical protein [Shewanella aestuarii]|uniref:Uncharacterized protein n=1 Tax=Shewanella aestuarii TaxID=1028752 RepID=A0A6G9QS92_9GAMM|nr:hypothetical protein [Shewanella aestuarii]QIR16649.1 hypothetical protein HBH39_19440 [Shewanella aestuarii]